MKEVADALTPKWAATKSRIHYIAAYYDDFNQVIDYAEKTFGWKQVPDGSHDDALITAIMMTVSPDHVRMKQRIAKGKTSNQQHLARARGKDRRNRPPDRQLPRRPHGRGNQEGDRRIAEQSTVALQNSPAHRCGRRVQSLCGDRAFRPCSDDRLSWHCFNHAHRRSRWHHSAQFKSRLAQQIRVLLFRAFLSANSPNNMMKSMIFPGSRLIVTGITDSMRRRRPV